MEGNEMLDVNPGHRGGVPIGLFPDTIYSPNDVVDTTLTRSAVCIAHTDGLMDLSRDVAGEEVLPPKIAREVRAELVESARKDGTITAGRRNTSRRFRNSATKSATTTFRFSSSERTIRFPAFTRRRYSSRPTKWTRPRSVSRNGAAPRVGRTTASRAFSLSSRRS